MARSVYKFDFPMRPDISPVLELAMCDPEVVLVFQQSSVLPTVWIEHDLDLAANTVLTLEVIGTGQPVTEGMTHVGSAVCGHFVWHVYGKKETV